MHIQRHSRPKLSLCVVFLSFAVHGSSALSETWDVTMDARSPDCVRKPALLINGEFPGPILRIQPGEKVEIVVNNHVPNLAISVHFHGQTQFGSPYMDGTTMVSMCPTGPHQSFKYQFTANPFPGTTLYHLHVGGMRHMGVYGFVIAEDRPQDPLYRTDLAGERYLFLADWYHTPIQEIVTDLLSLDNIYPGNAGDSLLINGKGMYKECDQAAVAQVSSICDQRCVGRETLNVTSGGQYRFRIGSQTSQTHISVAIQNHNMTVIEVDGNPITPITVTSLDCAAGQRYSVLVNADQPPGVYTISFWNRIDGMLRSGYQYGKAELRYESAPPESQAEEISAEDLLVVHSASKVGRVRAADQINFGFDQQMSFRPLPGVTPPAPSAEDVTKRFVFKQTREYYDVGDGKNEGEYMEFCNRTEMVWKWGTNRVNYQGEREAPVALDVFDGRTEDFTEDRGYYALEKGDVVEVVLENYRACFGICYTHPWHLHGHHFWVVGQGHEAWTGSEKQLQDLEDGTAIYRDTVTAFTENPKGKAEPMTPCGYLVIRFVADNPGAWNFHCHLEWHAVMGMNTVFWYKDGSLPEPPAGLPCRRYPANEPAGPATPPEQAADESPHALGESPDAEAGATDPPSTEKKPKTGLHWPAVAGIVVLLGLVVVVAAVVVLRRRRAAARDGMLHDCDLQQSETDPPAASSSPPGQSREQV